LIKEYEYKDEDKRLYISMIGSLLYVTTSRPYMMQEVGKFVRFKEAPREMHVMAVKRIFKYLKET
jgi:hypothetical protein